MPFLEHSHDSFATHHRTAHKSTEDGFVNKYISHCIISIRLGTDCFRSDTAFGELTINTSLLNPVLIINPLTLQSVMSEARNAALRKSFISQLFFLTLSNLKISYVLTHAAINLFKW